MISQSDAPGFTASERYLGKLCRRTFLRLWSYQNIFTDRGVSVHQRQGKELCDLLVVFDNEVILFSDKTCAIKHSNDVWLDWPRWYRKAIEASALQLFGAERWIRSHPNRLFLDPDCSQLFQIPIPDLSNVRFHRVAVAAGATERCAAHFGNTHDGSLLLDSTLRGGDHVDPEKASVPFCVGHVNPSQGYVHVFDELSLDTILDELDTVTDFVAFLHAKEDAFSRSQRVYAAGNKYWLGFYLANGGTQVDFRSVMDELLASTQSGVQITESVWEDFCQSEFAQERKLVRDAGKFIDNLIEHFTDHVLGGTLIYHRGGGLVEQERNLRFLAAEPRYIRAGLSVAIAQKLATTPRNRRTSIVLPSHFPNRVHVFILLSKPVGQTVHAFRQGRHALMAKYALVAKHLNPNVKYVICFATEPGRQHSEDLLSFEFAEWTDEDDKKAKLIQDDENILKTVVTRKVSELPNTNPGYANGNRFEQRKARAIRRKRQRS